MSMLTSLNELKKFLRIPQSETGLDDQLTTLIEETSDDCERFCSRSFAKQAYSNETHEGGGTKVVLDNVPVDLTQTFQLKDFDGQTTTIRDASDYYVNDETGVVSLLSGLTFSEGPNAVQVSYNAGYDTISGGTSDEKIDVSPGLSRSVRRVCAARFQADQGAITEQELLAVEQAERDGNWSTYRLIP